MRFSCAETMGDPSHYLALAKAAEAAGWSSFIVPDSIAYPEVSDSKYPYTPDGDRSFLEDKPFIEPFVLIAAMAAVTENLRFTTFVLKLPVRHPVLAAKSVGSLAVLSNDRFGLGVGLSPWPEDFVICGQEWKNRGKRMDEMIEIIRGLNRGGYYEFHGDYYDIPSIKMCPLPSKPVPVLIGGHSEAALRRAARLGDGWMHAGSDRESLDALLLRLNTLRQEYGREHEAFEIHVLPYEGCAPEEIKRLEDLGVTDIIAPLRHPYAGGPQPTLEQKIADLESFAEMVISKV